MVKIKVLAGSVRPGRFNVQVAQWVHDIALGLKNIDVELIDLKKVNLPFHNETAAPLTGEYTLSHTKNWAKTIGGADGFVFVTPEYNHSYSAALKNAIDYLAAEWKYKPVAMVSYGAEAGGARAVEHLRGVAAQLHMFDIKEQIVIPNYWTNLDESGKYKFSQDQEAAATELLNELAFWADVMKEARHKRN